MAPRKPRRTERFARAAASRTKGGRACARSHRRTETAALEIPRAADCRHNVCLPFQAKSGVPLARSRKIGQGSRMARNFRAFVRTVARRASAAVARGLAMCFSCCFVGFIVAYRFVDPVSTIMLGRMVTAARRSTQKFVPLDRISENLRVAVVTSEDAHFCHHHGVDWGAMREVIDESGIDGPSRGASTITMQVAKNLFLWPGRSYIRKAFEIPARARPRFRLAEAPHPRNLPQHRRMGRRRHFRRRGGVRCLFPRASRRSHTAAGGAPGGRAARSAGPQRGRRRTGASLSMPMSSRRAPRPAKPIPPASGEIDFLGQVFKSHRSIRLPLKIGCECR